MDFRSVFGLSKQKDKQDSYSEERSEDVLASVSESALIVPQSDEDISQVILQVSSYSAPDIELPIQDAQTFKPLSTDPTSDFTHISVVPISLINLRQCIDRKQIIYEQMDLLLRQIGLRGLFNMRSVLSYQAQQGHQTCGTHLSAISQGVRLGPRDLIVRLSQGILRLICYHSFIDHTLRGQSNRATPVGEHIGQKSLG